MTADSEAEAADRRCCASCGTTEVDDIKLKKCNACDLVRYCSEKCQQEHRTQHAAICKRRAAELRDEILFRQPECSHYGDCTICFLPLSIDIKKSTLMGCCSKVICNGCVFANVVREMKERLKHKCPFCRQEESDRNKMKRVAANDPVAIQQMGSKHYHEGDYERAVEYYNKAAVLGDAKAHYYLSVMYREGQGVEKDEEKAKYYAEEAAIAGHPEARHNLACHEGMNDRIDKAVKHFIIAANLGYDKSIQALKECYVKGEVNKEDFATALRAHQAAVNATKSPQREVAEKVFDEKLED